LGLEAGFYSFRGVAITVVNAIIHTFTDFFVIIEKCYNKLAKLAHLPMSDLTEGIQELTKGLDIEANNAFESASKAFSKFESGDSITSVKNTFSKVKTDAEAGAKAIADGVDKANKLGLDSQVKNAKKNDDMAGQKAHQKELDELQKKADSLTKALETPLEKFKNTMQETIDLYQAGFIDDDIYNRSLQKAEKDFKTATEAPKENNSFKQIDASLINVEGLKKQEKSVQEVKSSQLETVSKYLLEIKTLLIPSSGGILVGA
jgi:hypothetical protein